MDFSNPKGFARVFNKALGFLKPPEDLSPSDWFEQHVKIPLGNAIPGFIRFDNAPYQREPLDMFAEEGVERITLMWGAQLGANPIFTPGLRRNSTRWWKQTSC